MHDTLVAQSLATLRSQFLDGASRYPRVAYRFVEWSGGVGGPDMHPPRRQRSTPASSHSTAARYTFKPAVAPPERYFSFLAPNNVVWHCEVGTDDLAAFEAYSRMAESAWKLLLAESIKLPAPLEFETEVREQHPRAESFLPDWSADCFSFAHVVCWLARYKAHPALSAEAKSWYGQITCSADPAEYRRFVEAFAGHESGGFAPPADRDLPRERIFVDIPDLFMASVWAIDWITAQVEDRARQAAPVRAETPETGATTGRKGKPKGTGLSLDDRAVALLVVWLKQGRKISVAAIARELGASRSSLYRCKTFGLMRKRHEATGPRPPSGSKDAKTGLVEAYEESEDDDD